MLIKISTNRQDLEPSCVSIEIVQFYGLHRHCSVPQSSLVFSPFYSLKSEEWELFASKAAIDTKYLIQELIAGWE